MAYKHGAYVSEVPTDIVSPVQVDSAFPIFFVTAPVHLASDPYGVTNVPKLCYTYKEAVEAFGYNIKESIWNNYTAVEVINSQFVLYNVAPMVIINVLDPKIHKEDKSATIQIANAGGLLEVDGVLIDTVKLKKDDDTYFVLDTDYSLAFNNEGFIVINCLNTEINTGEVDVEYIKIDPTMVDEYDIIGGYNVATGKNEGLELINEIYPRFRKVPAQIVAPKFSTNTTVATVMETKASLINGCFKAIALIDLPSELRYTELAQYKNDENLVSTRELLCYPKLRNGEQVYDYSAQFAGLIAKTDSENGGVPYVSPSNKNLKINGLVDNNNNEIILLPEQANYLNSNGIIAAINFVNGWTAWGSQTAIYTSSTDVKDATLQIRRIFDWIGNTSILTYWSKVDGPLTKRGIYSIVDSVNMWLNGLAGGGFIVGGTASFSEEDNSMTDLLNGDIVIKFDITPPLGMKSIEFKQQFNVDNLSKLFS